MLEKWKNGEKWLTLPPSNLSLFCLLFIIIFAFSLRVVKLNNLPLSLNLDEAIDGLDALNLFRLGQITPFLQNNFGRETLFFYLQGLILWFGGISIFSLRFASVLAGTLTIPLLYRVGQQLGLKKAVFNHQLPSSDNLPPLNLTAILAATGLAVSYWHIYFSRVGLRAIFLPPLLLGLISCFWRGWYPSSPTPGLPTRGIQKGWLTAAGFLLGLSLYTYLAARLVPLLFIVFIVIELLRCRFKPLEKLWGLLIFSGVAAITAAPLLLYFWQNPQAFGSRTQAISIFAGAAPLETLFNNFVALLRIHFLANSWSGQWPALDLVSAIGLLLGLPVCLYHVKKPACLFLLLWWIIGIMPVLLSEQDWEGSTTLLRGIMAWPALYLISALGLTTLIRRAFAEAKKQMRIHHPLAASPTLRLLASLSVLFVFGAVASAYNYFFVWAATYNDFSDQPPRMAHYLNNQTNQLTLTPMRFYGESVANFLLQARYPHLVNIDGKTLRSLLETHQQVVYLLPNESTHESVFVLLVPGAQSQGTAYLLPALTSAQIQAMADHTRKLVPLTAVLDSEQEPIAQVYPLTADAPFLPSGKEDILWQPSAATFNNNILLTGFQVAPTLIKPGETVTLFLNWQARQPIDGDYYLFIHLFDIAHRQPWGQVNTPLSGLLFSAHRWPVGLTVPDVHHFTLPAAAPDGAYRFEVGLYHASSQQRLPVKVDPTAPPTDNLILGKFQVRSKPPPLPQFPFTDKQFGNGIALMGLDLPASTLQPGQTLSFNLHWQALATIAKDYTVFTHLVNTRGQLEAQQDNAPQQGYYPTSWWDPGEIVFDPYTLTLPPDLAPGQYTLRVGLYELETGRRLPVLNEGQDYVDLPQYIYVTPNHQ